jgi:hypothetical protein
MSSQPRTFHAIAVYEVMQSVPANAGLLGPRHGEILDFDPSGDAVSTSF